jgi:tubulin beta
VSGGNNWSIGHYTEGAEIVDSVLNVIRKEAESCNRLHGFNYTFSLGGGTGSGLGTLIQSKVREEYPDRMTQSFNVFPSPNINHCVVEPFNAVLTVHHLVQNQDLVHVFDNEALIAYQSHVHPNAGKSFRDLNQHVATVMSDASSGIRFPGNLNCDLRKLGVNLVPFPRLHFFADNIFSKQTSPEIGPELVQMLFNPTNTLCSVDFRDGKTLTAGVAVRGPVSSFEVENNLQLFGQKNSNYFSNWIPNNINISMCKHSLKPQEVTGMCMNGTTSIRTVFKHIITKFAHQFRRKAHLHWYTREGMDEMEFTEAESNLSDLMSEYQQYQDVQAANHEDEEEE